MSTEHELIDGQYIEVTKTPIERDVEGSEVPLEEVTPTAEENTLTQQDGLGEPDAQEPSTDVSPSEDGASDTDSSPDSSDSSEAVPSDSEV